MNEKAIEAKMSDLELNAPDGNDDHPAVQAFLNRKEKPAMTIPEQAVEKAKRALRGVFNYLDPEDNKHTARAISSANSIVDDLVASLVGVERAALPPLRAREEIAAKPMEIPGRPVVKVPMDAVFLCEEHDCCYVLQSALSRTTPEGWQLVPKEPTPEMLDAADKREDDEPLSSWGRITPAPFDEIYRAMLAAAPPVAEKN